MYKTRDFYYKNVYDIKGKKIGVVEDLFIDFFQEKIMGIKVAAHKLFSKKNYISIENIIEIGNEIIALDIDEYCGLEFKNIKNMEVLNLQGEIKGILEDIIIDAQGYCIKGLIVSSGIIDRLLNGKDIILLKECVLGEKYILYFGDEKIKLKTLPHRLGKTYESTKV
ncbi:MAG: photosystem reaction center subunit H [Clostridium butyricum]|nr:photosystem reaction center subunit H [Clostridium butyricum]